MINNNHKCFICKELLIAKEDKIHFRCQTCDIDWHIEDFNGKMERIIKLLKLPKDKNSLSFKQAKRKAYTLLYRSSWLIWGIKNSGDREKNKRNDILLIHKDSNLEFLVKNSKTVVSYSRRRNHCWYYKVYHNIFPNKKGKLILDGEYISKNEIKGKQGNMIDEVLRRLDIIIAEADYRQDNIIKNYDLKEESFKEKNAISN